MKGNRIGGIWWLKEKHLFPLRHVSFTGDERMVRDLLLSSLLISRILTLFEFCIHVHAQVVRVINVYDKQGFPAIVGNHETLFF